VVVEEVFIFFCDLTAAWCLRGLSSSFAWLIKTFLPASILSLSLAL
jgi:hypothetical protein